MPKLDQATEEKIMDRMYHIHEYTLKFVDSWIENKRKFKPTELERSLYHLKRKLKEVENLYEGK